MRWLYHAMPRSEPLGERYAPASRAREGFVHASFRDDAAESARLYLKGVDVVVLQIDPRLLDCEVRVVDTPRGPMPHIHGSIPRAAIVALRSLDELPSCPDAID